MSFDGWALPETLWGGGLKRYQKSLTVARGENKRRESKGRRGSRGEKRKEGFARTQGSHQKSAHAVEYIFVWDVSKDVFRGRQGACPNGEMATYNGR